MKKGEIIVVANWKNNTTLADAHILAMGVRNHLEHIDGVKVVLCPPMVWVTEVRNIVHDQIHDMAVGVQDISGEPTGPVTGEVAADLVKGLVQYAIIGHSERISLYNESVEVLNDKIHAAINNNIRPIICVGEEHQSGAAGKSLVHRLESLLKTIKTTDRDKCLIAYEPIWAISKGPGKEGRSASPEYANEVITNLKKAVPATTKMLYGGSVKADNAVRFVAQPNIDGLLVGGASLSLREFTTLVKNVSRLAEVGQ